MRGTPDFLLNTPLGHYRAAIASGLITTLAANATIFSMQMPAPAAGAGSIYALIKRIRLTESIITPFTSAQEFASALFIARSFTAPDTAGTAVSFADPSNQQNSGGDAPSSALMRVATAAAVSAGTRTLDANPIIAVFGAQAQAAASAGPNVISNMFAVESDQESGILLAPTEGLVWNNSVLMGAAGVGRALIELEWVEFRVDTNVPGVIA